MRRTLGTVVMAVAVLTAAAGVALAASGQRVVAATEGAFLHQLALTEEALSATNAAVGTAGEAIGDVSAGLDGAATTVLIAGGALRATTELLDEVSVLLGEELPDTIDSFRATMPGLIATASAVDATLRAVDVFTPDEYAPDVPLDEAVADLDEAIADLPDDLRSQAALLRTANGTLVGMAVRMEETASDVVTVRAALVRAERAMAEYGSTTARALEDLDAARADADALFDMAAIVAVVGGLVVVASQLGSFVLGWLLFRGAVVAPANGEGEAAES